MSSILFLILLAIIIGIMLSFVAYKFKSNDDPLVNQINELLPQTQCAQCGYPGCKPYAKAIANGEAEINLCPPGGTETIIALADLLNREPLELADKGDEEPVVAIIDEERCIGCVICIKACPVDAIIGATKLMHSVIESECTGCRLCVPVCPVDCIDIITVAERKTLVDRYMVTHKPVEMLGSAQ